MEYTEDKLTQWFDIHKQKPWEPGVYECTLEYLGSRVVFGYFDGQSFVRFEHDIDRLLDRMYQGCVKWRGLASSPSAPKKRAGNKKVTRWLHITGMMDSDLIHKVHGVYKTKQEAENARDKRNSKGWRSSIRHIRFRTPEA